MLYIGTATDLRRRVGQYFNGSDPRGRMKEMVGLAAAVDHIECAHPLEAGVRELRLLAAHAPPYNRRSRFPHRWWWVVLTDEAFPRLSVVREPRHDRAIGPFRSRADAADTAELVARFTGVRTCTARIGRTAEHGPACPEREVAPCPAPRGISAAEYGAAPQRAAALIEGLDNTALAAAVQRVTELAGRSRYESAARLRDQTAAAVDVLWRGQRLRALAAVEELVAAAPDGAGGWQLVVVRHGQLAAAGTARRSVPPMPVVDALRGRGAGDPAAGRTAGRRAGRGDRADRPLAGRTGRPDCLLPQRVSRRQSARPARGRRGPRRRARRGWPPSRRSGCDSELLREPHPTREELLGRPGVDRFGSPAQPLLPGRQPFGVAG